MLESSSFPRRSTASQAVASWHETFDKHNDAQSKVATQLLADIYETTRDMTTRQKLQASVKAAIGLVDESTRPIVGQMFNSAVLNYIAFRQNGDRQGLTRATERMVNTLSFIAENRKADDPANVLRRDSDHGMTLETVQGSNIMFPSIRVAATKIGHNTTNQLRLAQEELPWMVSRLKTRAVDPHDDLTVLFIEVGMTRVQNLFGPPKPAQIPQAATSHVSRASPSTRVFLSSPGS